MTYTREEWETAATEASKVSEQAWMAFSTALTLVEGTKAYRKVFEGALIKAYIEISELREKLAAAEDKHRCLCDSTLKQERDRLRQALEEIQDLDRCVSTFQCRKVAFKALAQPEEKP